MNYFKLLLIRLLELVDIVKYDLMEDVTNGLEIQTIEEHYLKQVVVNINV